MKRFGKSLTVLLLAVVMGVAATLSAFAENETEWVIADTEPVKITDPDTGVTFILPVGWKECELTEGREYLDRRFQPIATDFCMVLYGSVDLWKKMSPQEKAMFSGRHTLDNSYISAKDISELMDVDSVDVSEVTYNGVKYYQVTHGTDMLAMKEILYLENGWCYIFGVMTLAECGHNDDFLSIMNSVEYPVVSYEKDGTDHSGAILVMVTVVAGVISGVVISEIRSKKKKKELERMVSIGEYQVKEVSLEKLYCENCGNKLTSGGEYCEQCGHKV